jgi:hypothetical protein
MAEIRVTKVEAARRQIELSIRLLFQNEDPIGIHSLVAAGFRILRDLGSVKTDSEINQHLKHIIKPGMEGKLWQSLNCAANFFKHAERDPDDMLEGVQEEINDVFILFACVYYRDIGYEWTAQMLSFVAWYIVLNPVPEVLSYCQDDAVMKQMLGSQELSVLKNESRHEQLAKGKMFMERVCLLTKNAWQTITPDLIPRRLNSALHALTR